ncbi:MAG: NAD-dependent dehydratase [Candidatus Binatia bacterium]|nr:MAG: NAD-dependent dehydratase [Candidatus Binatia bacterium]
MGRILVVGGAGYVGAVLVQELLERGYAVRVVDRLYFGDEGLREVRDRCELVARDMRTVGAAELSDTEAVVNLGGLSNDPTAEYNPRANFEMNALAAERLARLAKEHGVRRYVLASSCSIYDSGGREESDRPCSEDDPVAPRAAYATSKLEAERRVLALADDTFCPVVLRKGTVGGFSPRMRYDLVLNTFVKDALDRGEIVLFYGGEMWRPVVDVRDVARAYIACLEAPEQALRGQIFNLAYRNVRISELGLRVLETLRELGIRCEVRPDYRYRGVRSYRVSTAKIQRVLGFTPLVSIEDSVRHLVQEIERSRTDDFHNPKYYNLRWLQLLEEAERILGRTTSIFDVPVGNDPPRHLGVVRKGS